MPVCAGRLVVCCRALLGPRVDLVAMRSQALAQQATSALGTPSSAPATPCPASPTCGPGHAAAHGGSRMDEEAGGTAASKYHHHAHAQHTGDEFAAAVHAHARPHTHGSTRVLPINTADPDPGQHREGPRGTGLTPRVGRGGQQSAQGLDEPLNTALSAGDELNQGSGAHMMQVGRGVCGGGDAAISERAARLPCPLTLRSEQLHAAALRPCGTRSRGSGACSVHAMMLCMCMP